MPQNFYLKRPVWPVLRQLDVERYKAFSHNFGVMESHHTNCLNTNM